MPYRTAKFNFEKQWHLEYDGSVSGNPNYRSFMKSYVYNTELRTDSYIYNTALKSKKEIFDHTQFNNKVFKPYLEIISPAMKYSYLTKTDDTGLDKFSKIMIKVLPVGKNVDYWNNENTSTHVHMSFQGLEDIHKRPLIIVKLFYAWFYFEPLFLMLCGSWRRNNNYCQNYKNRFASRYNMFKQDINDSNFMDFINVNFPKVKAEIDECDKPGCTQEQYTTKIIVALLTIIQGGPYHSDRYFSLNLLNLLPGGIGTVEFRIKQGSNDTEENKMFMLLLAEFIEGIMNLYDKNIKEHIMVSANYKDTPIVDDFWNLHNLLITNNWSRSEHTKILFDDTPVPVKTEPPISTYEKMKKGVKSLYTKPEPVKKQKLIKTDKEIIVSLFKIFFGYIKDTNVRKYWQKVVDKLYNTNLAPMSLVNENPAVTVNMHEATPDSIMEGGREQLQFVGPPVSLKTSMTKNNSNDIFMQPVEDTYKHMIKELDYNKIKPALNNIKKNKKRILHRSSYTSSFGLVDYDKLQEIMNNNGYEKLYAAYKEDMKMKPKYNSKLKAASL